MNERHEDTCYFCGEPSIVAIEGHHIVPQRLNGSDEAENVVNLCGSCHNKIEELYDDEFYERLGIAVDEFEPGEVVDDDPGVVLNARETTDREIPANSPHVKFEDWKETIHIQDIEDGTVPDGLEEFIDRHKKSIMEQYEEEEQAREPPEAHFDDIPEWVKSEGDNHVVFDYEHTEEPEYPPLTVKNPHKNRWDHELRAKDDDFADQISVKKAKWESHYSQDNRRHSLHIVENQKPPEYRMHCGYCHTVYAQYEHADMARHLRIRHGIENPYEQRDTKFASPSETNPLEGIMDNDY